MCRHKLGSRLVIAQTSHEGHGSDIGDMVHVAEKRYQNLAVHKAAAVEQRKNKVHSRMAEQNFIIVGNRQIDTQALQTGSHLMMVDGMIAIFGMHAAAPVGVFCEI